MKRTDRNLWIIIAAVVVVFCLCVALAGAAVVAAVGLFTVPVFRGGGMTQVAESTANVFNVGDTPALEVDNFAGDIVVRRGERGETRIVVTRRAGSEAGLDRIDVDVVERDDVIYVESAQAGNLPGNRSVHIEAIVSPDTELDLYTGAGNIEIDDVEGEISAQTGAGNVAVSGADAPVALETGAGNIEYQGDPEGLMTFNTGAGDIRLYLPPDRDVELDLDAGIGDVDVNDFDVDGDIDRTGVDGAIGTGEDATIEADTAVGNIRVSEQ